MCYGLVPSPGQRHPAVCRCVQRADVAMRHTDSITIAGVRTAVQALWRHRHAHARRYSCPHTQLMCCCVSRASGLWLCEGGGCPRGGRCCVGPTRVEQRKRGHKNGLPLPLVVNSPCARVTSTSSTPVMIMPHVFQFRRHDCPCHCHLPSLQGPVEWCVAILPVQPFRRLSLTPFAPPPSASCMHAVGSADALFTLQPSEPFHAAKDLADYVGHLAHTASGGGGQPIDGDIAELLVSSEAKPPVDLAHPRPQRSSLRIRRATCFWCMACALLQVPRAVTAAPTASVSSPGIELTKLTGTAAC
jgi:hypothetical protein